MFTFAQTLKMEIAKKAVSLGFYSSVVDTIADRWWQYMTDTTQCDYGNKKYGLQDVEQYFDGAINKKDKGGSGFFDSQVKCKSGNIYWIGCNYGH